MKLDKKISGRKKMRQKKKAPMAKMISFANT
jgi:hypothetical protein